MERQTKLSRQQTAVYVASLCEELRTLAQDMEADGLEYLLGMAIYEAKRVVDQAETNAGRAALDIQRLYMSDTLDD